MGARERVGRRLAAILVADVVSSSRLIETDEPGALRTIQAALSDVLVPTAVRHGGRLVKTTGDGALIEFARWGNGPRLRLRPLGLDGGPSQ